MVVKNKMGKMMPDVDSINVIQNAKFHAWRNFLHFHDVHIP
jgi:hypothetical protein